MSAFEVFRHLSHLMQSFFLGHQYVALFIFLLVEESGVPLPIPGDALVMFTGFLATQGQSKAFLVIPLATAATAAGSSIPYWIAHRLGHPFVMKYGRFIRLDARRVAWVERWFQKRGAVAIVVGRLIPGMRTPTSVMSGVFEVPYHTFVPATTIAAAIWAGIYFTLGFVFGAEYRLISEYFVRNYRWAIVTLAIMVVATAIFFLARRTSLDFWSERNSETE